MSNRTEVEVEQAIIDFGKKLKLCWSAVGDCVDRDGYDLIRAVCLKYGVTISSEDENRISYARYPELRYNDDRRTKISFSRFLSRSVELSPLKYDTGRWSTLCNTLGTRLFFDTQLVVEEYFGDDIPRVYTNLEKMYHISSCMSHDLEATSLYACNPQNTSLLLFKFRGLCCRALKLKLDNGDTWIEKRYPNDNYELSEVTRMWIKDNGYIDGRTAGSYGLTMTWCLPDDDSYPYIDTFCYSYNERMDNDKTIATFSSTNENCIDGGYEYRNTDYTRSDVYEDAAFCCCCGERLIDESEMFSLYDDIYCESCYNDNTFKCALCGCTTPIGDKLECEGDFICRDCYDNNIGVCANCGANCFLENIDTRWDGCNLCPDCAKECTPCRECGGLVSSDDATVVDGNTYCPDCYEKKQQESDEQQNEEVVQ